MCPIGVPEEGTRGNETEWIFQKANAEAFPGLLKGLWYSDAGSSVNPNRINEKESTRGHIIVKHQREKEDLTRSDNVTESSLPNRQKWKSGIKNGIIYSKCWENIIVT